MTVNGTGANRAPKSPYRWIIPVAAALAVIVLAILVFNDSSPKKKVYQDVYLNALGIHENQDYQFVPLNNRTNTETRHFWAMSSGELQVRFAVIIERRRVPVDFASGKITWVEDANAKTPTARLYLRKGRGIKVPLQTDLWDMEPKVGHPDLGMWQQRIRYYQRRPGGTPVGTIVAEGVYNITIVVSPQTFNQEVLPLRAA